MPGFPQGLKAELYRDLADRINIIAGANGTGKSSTARVIQRLIWWNPKARLNATAELQIDNRSHQIQIQSPIYQHTDPQGNTDEKDFKTFVSENFDKQYILALHDLVKGDDNELAKDLIKEINGGFDLDSAADNLDYEEGIYNTNQTRYKEYVAANQRLSIIRREQETLRGKQQQIEKLKAEAQKAKEALQAKTFYANLGDWLRIKAKQEQHKALLAGFSPVLERLRTDDWENIRKLEKKIEEDQKEITLFEQKKTEAEDELSRIRLPQTGREEIAWEELDAYKDELEQKKKEIELLSQEIMQWEETRKNAVAAIGLTDNQSTKAFHLEEIRDLDTFIRKANQAESAYHALNKQKEKLALGIKEKEAAYPQKPQNTITLNNGIAELSRWLKSENAPTTRTQQRIVGLAILGGLTALAVLAWGWPGLAGLLLMIALLIYDRMSLKKEKEATLSSAIAYYNQLGLEPLPAWNSETVTARLEELIGQLRSVEHLNNLQQQCKELEVELAQAEKTRDTIRKEYKELTEKLALSADSLNWETEGYNVFFYFIQKLLEIQKAETERQKREQALEKLQSAFDTVLEAGNKQFLLLGEQPVDNPAAFKARVTFLRKQLSRQKELLSDVGRDQGLITQYRKQQEENQQALRAIYERLDGREKEEIRLLDAQLEAYRKTKKTFEDTATILRDRQQTLAQSALYREAFEAFTVEEAIAFQQQSEGEAERYGPLIEEIKTIEAEIGRAESGNDLEEAIARQENAVKGLEDVCETNLQSITGSLIVKQLKQEISLNNENKVFREANRILGDITQERYGLTLSYGKDAAFKAKDQINGTILNLEELSTGTRVQLLLAIRLAYIQSLEKQIKLPILADELLANSDDQRSEAIIRSLIAISKERQVFYFTAQMDEVNKWKSFLQNEPERTNKIIILDEESRQKQVHQSQVQPVLWFDEVPEPGTLSHAAYRRLLPFQPFNLLEQQETELHLWYLFDQPTQLYPFLQRGINRWGQLKQLREKGNAANLNTEAWQKIDQKISLLQSFIELYRIGRPMRIDREVLEASGAITSKYIDPASAVLEACQGDPLVLLEALKNTSGFRVKKIDELRDYLIKHKYIDGKDPLETDEIQIALQSRISAMGMDPQTADQFIKQLL